MRTVTNAKQNHATGIVAQVPWYVIEVVALQTFQLYVKFADATKGTVDLSSFLERDCGVFKALRNAEVFNAVFIEHGAVTWPGELDLAPDKMHDELQKSDVYRMV